MPTSLHRICSTLSSSDRVNLHEPDRAPRRAANAVRNEKQTSICRDIHPSRPDGSQVVFTWRGDLWKVSSQGGCADRLTSHVADDTYSAWSRDGQRIAFSSNRAGGINLFIMNADGTDIRQVTNTDRSLGLVGFGVDENNNEVLTLQAYLETDAYRSPRPYMVPTERRRHRPRARCVRLVSVGQPGRQARVVQSRQFELVSSRISRLRFARHLALHARRQELQTSDDVERQRRPAKWINNDEFVFSSDRK